MANRESTNRKARKKPIRSASTKTSKPASALTVRIDVKSRQLLTKAAKLRAISVSDYIRTVTVPQAKLEVHGESTNLITVSAADQLQFWKPLNAEPVVTKSQRRLARVIRGEA